MSVRNASADGLGLIWLDADGHLVQTNAAVRSWIGDATRLNTVLPQLDLSRWREQSGPDNLTMSLRRGDGSDMPVKLHLAAIPNHGGFLLCVSPSLAPTQRTTIDAIQRSVLEAVATAQPLVSVMDLLCREVEAALPEVLCSVLMVDAQGRLRPLAAPSLPTPYGEAIDGLAIGPKVGSCGTAAWRQAAVEVQSIATDPLWEDFRSLALQYGLAACWSTPVMLDDGRVAATFAIYQRTEAPVADYHRHLVHACTQLCKVALLHHEHEARIERLAYFDSTTDLPNRRLFTQRAEALLQQLTLSNTPGALLLMDLDRFKAINELQGHAAGNEVLRRVAQRLAGCLPGMETLARLGDDEFVVLLPHADRALATHTADAICAALSDPLPLRDQELKLGISVGFSCFPDDGVQLENLMKHADLALNHAKDDGRHCAKGFTAAMARELEEKSWMEAALRKALAAHELQLHFQPKVHLGTGAVLGAEVLLRWPCAGRGWVPPDRFIPLAEECGLINAIDAWVLEAACAQLAQWHTAGLVLPTLAVNVSPSRFQHADVVQHLKQLLLQHQLSASAVTLEVTERLMLDEANDRRAVAQLGALRALGVGVSIDDFGTGYSSLSYLRRLPISELKLDRSFVNSLVENAEDRALSRAVVSIAQAMSLSLVAEGVETAEQAQMLLQLGCEVAQGYWLSRPLAADAFVRWFSAQQVAGTALPL